MIESHEYMVNLTARSPKTGVIDSPNDPLPTLEVGSPPEFGGPGGMWSPEHLFVASIASCLMTTFYAIAAISGLDVLQYEDEAIGHLQRGEDRLYLIDRVLLRPTVVVGDETEVVKAKRLLMKAEDACLIGRSVVSKIEMEATVLVRREALIRS